MMIRLLLVGFTLLISLLCTYAQMPQPRTSGQIYHNIQKLGFLGSALYVAAHPDDENQRMIAHLSNAYHARTAYLSLTRGDGGQNLVGAEIRELLGLIRTQELLAARRWDGGTQFFSRANDFGYSKTPKETLDIWEQEEVLSDVVWILRRWQPDVIINRFSHEEGSRRTHGHHTSSAILSVQAFDKAADPLAFPEQLKYVNTWQARRLFFNTSWWFYGSKEKFSEADKSAMMSIDVGNYYPVLGISNTEISAKARSQHKSQGFGDMGTRGSQQEYLQLIKGDMPAQKKDLFEGINTRWSRVQGGAAIGVLVDSLLKAYDFTNPAASVPLLLTIRSYIQDLPEREFWREVKLQEVNQLISDCTGLFLEASASKAYNSPGQVVELQIEAINRSPIPVVLQGLSLREVPYDTIFQQALTENTSVMHHQEVVIPIDHEFSSPYWLTEQGSLGMYAVPDQKMRGMPESAPALTVRFSLSIGGQQFFYDRPVVYKYEDPVKGEVYEPFHILPTAFVTFEQNNHILNAAQPYPVSVQVQSSQDQLQGELELKVPADWKCEPATQQVEIQQQGQSAKAVFMITPPEGQSQMVCTAQFHTQRKTYDQRLVSIDYAHIPKQTVLLPAQAQFAKLDVRTGGERIGYLMGAGDEVPSALRQIGYEVVLLDDADITSENLATFDAIITGVRAYNTRENIAVQQPLLLEYVRGGGNLIVQYNTAHRLQLPMSDIAPYPLNISRQRITEEDAVLSILAPNHPAMTTPNRITQQDFAGWVQERGLYFPDEWSAEYTPLLSGHDTGEESLQGGLLVASYGKGHYVYSGYSWFRQLPAGVPGAYRLLANLIAL